MKVLGISGSPRKGSTTDQLVQEVLAGVEGCETEFVSLAGKKIGPCLACLGCVETNICRLKDDLAPMRQTIVDSDAYVIGGANYFNNLNSLTHCFMERWYQFRHRDSQVMAGKLGVAVGVGSNDPKPVIEVIRNFYKYNQIECVGEVEAKGAASCFICGYGETCQSGAIHFFYGPGAKITEEITPSLTKQPQSRTAARELGMKLSERLHTPVMGM
ncbi:MAG: flavodoxin family protein [Candidatus Omnitrophota bacterium]